MATVYSLRCGGETPRHTLSIDPGLSTTGFCYFNPEERRVEIFDLPTRKSGALTSLPDLIGIVVRRVDEYEAVLNRFERVEQMEVVMEYTFLGGYFSAGLTGLLTAAADRFRGAGVSSVAFAPPSIGGFFLRTRATKKSTVVRFVKENFGSVITLPKKLSSHMADAFLISYYRYHRAYRKCFPNIPDNVREPDFTVASIAAGEDRLPGSSSMAALGRSASRPQALPVGAERTEGLRTMNSIDENNKTDRKGTKKSMAKGNPQT